MAWFKSLRRKNPLEHELDRELRFHIEELAREKVAAGMTPQEAHRQAMLEFGGKEQVTEQLREVYRPPVIATMSANLRLAWRLMRRTPVLSATVILTLALGIGANSAVFSAIDAVLLRPLPFPHGDELMRLQQHNPKETSPQTFVAPVRLEDWNRMNTTFQAMTGYYAENDTEISGPIPEKLTHALVAPRFLQVLGVEPALGRDFNPEEERFGGPNAVLISDRWWRRRFAADPGVLGKTLRFDNYSMAIVGVMPPSFAFPDRDTDIWSAVAPEGPYAGSRESTWYTVIGRLKPGIRGEQAANDLALIQTQLGKQFPKTDANLAVRVGPLKQERVGGSRRSLWILFGSVTLLLLIACTNITALLLARTTEREHEISIRFSLGASRRLVMAQLLTEVFLLALFGSLAGLGLAALGTNVFRVFAPNLPRVDEIALDWRIVCYCLVSTVVVTFLCGMLPALCGSQGAIARSLARGSKKHVTSRNPMQWALVGVQVALAVTLLVGAGLLQRSLAELGRVSPGFEPGHVLTLHISGSWGETVDMKGLTQRIDRTLEALRAVPGIEAAATTATLPGVPGQRYPVELRILEGGQDPNRKIVAENRVVSTGYFNVMHIPLFAGEPCRDLPNARAVVVNRSFANTYFSHGRVIGHHLGTGALSQFPLMGEIRGIVGDAREQGIDTEPAPTVYWCLNAPDPDPYYILRTRGEPLTLSATVRETIHQIEPNRSVFDVQPLTGHLDDAFAEDRLRTGLLSLFALTAMLLACLGLYGTLSYFVTVRRREVGLRLALGALPRQIALRFLLQGLRVSLIGCAFGLALSAAAAQLISGVLYGVSRFDPATFSGVILLVLTVAALATILPAARAASIDPMRVLREE
jgi:putative ABC transport system permease protein